ncbi:phosphatase PAP2 family protein [Sphingobium aromaticivastans]|uniref:phosphatase PAP2 family protein n=1 Tax=Sphingobium aromaticivastans TaxID=1778665 RepID=UPI003015E296
MLTAIFNKVNLKAQAVTPGPLFDPRSGRIYIMILLWMAICSSIFAFSGFTIGTRTFPIMFASLCWAALNGLLARRYRMERTAMFMEALAVPAIIGAMGMVSIIAIAAISGPFVDGPLVEMDTQLHFDWRLLYQFYLEHPILMAVSRQAYDAFSYQLLLVPMILWLWRRGEMLWSYIAAYSVALILTIIIFPFFPAAGPYNHFGISHADLEPWQWNFGPYIEGLRSGHIRDMTQTSSGLISVPSFHAAAGVLFMWACGRIPYLRWVFLSLNTSMIVSALVIGSHYLVDLIAGVAVSIIAIGVAPLLVGGSRREQAFITAHSRRKMSGQLLRP